MPATGEPHRVVLVALGRPEAARACLAAAGQAAAVLGGARILALAPHPPASAMILPSEQVLTAELRAAFERQTESGIAALRRSFDAWRREPDAAAAAAEWVEAEGSAETVVAEHGQAAELVVVAARPAAHESAEKELPAALLETHRPVLVVPDRIGARIGRHVCIAWHDDAPATAAVVAAMPFLAAADRVTVLQASRDGAPGTAGGPPAILAEHRIAAEMHPVATSGAATGEALLAAAHTVGGDLLVLGAYAHSRLRERLLGGVTATVLQTTDIPLLMRH